MVLTSSKICSMLFTAIGDNMHTCTTCGKTYKKGNGYTNVLNHLRRNRADYEQDTQEANPPPFIYVSSASRHEIPTAGWSGLSPDGSRLSLFEHRLTR
ncbi:hypothetical protein PC129_g20622 [Phytophthora cactorum]|uniref:BED-type domain-containing protein n=1 Tax=Phytophthora cactorum TaxID=29920 RepID=A0A329RCM2_9STRA|nr:hypothetical protein Pcac1_g823 [Phytophthora cactorum]KAG2818761.1 hypothetical protein PC111_g12185 [Phytophthora cactorum]KAG2832119.1 hypothetical protein PC113_g20813 [Phytophthora cactorum]KAG2877995.1 hypothetical protein PC114_g23350 [Phytophthora cactorum]KAG2963384.1 hypothetical protein PC118_g20927 [Phytophthora cactorum]